MVEGGMEDRIDRIDAKERNYKGGRDALVRSTIQKAQPKKKVNFRDGKSGAVT